MPLAPKYTWTETDVAIEVTVEVPGVSRSKADVFATDAFLKVNSPPYLFALDLAKDVDDTRSSATILPGKVVFTLFKREPGVWGVLAAAGEKAALTSRRNASIDRAYAALEAARKGRLERKQQEDKAATQRTMDTDRRKRVEVEARKAAELAEERGRIKEWQQGLGLDKEQDAESDYEDEEGDGEEGQQAGGGKGSEAAEAAAAAPDHPDYHGRGWRASDAKPAAAAKKAAAAAGAGTAGAAAKAPGRAKGKAGSDEEEEEDEERRAGGRGGTSFKPLPPPRAKLEPVQVTFTKLETGHLPARQQREEEIRAFRKQSHAAAALEGAGEGGGDGSDATDLAERQPLFLKDKGDGLFKAGNFSGALNAYNRAIALGEGPGAAAHHPPNPAVHSNRAACMLALGRPQEAAADCDRALELLAEARSRLESGLLGGPEAAALSRQLVRLLVRRAQARAAQLGPGGAGAGAGAGAGRDRDRDSDNLCAALRDYEDAIKLSPADAALAADRDELAAALAPADAAALRQRGDARFRSGDYEGAAEAFSALLGLPRGSVPEPERLAAFSNRAACHLVLERFAAAVADCDAGLALLLLLQPQQRAEAASSSSVFGMAAGAEGRQRLEEWAAAALPAAQPSSTGPQEPEPAAAQAAVSAARLLTRRGAAAAHLQDFAAAAADHALAAALLRRLGPEHAAKAEAAEADAACMAALAEGREQAPSRPAAASAASAEGGSQPAAAVVAGAGGSEAAAAGAEGGAGVGGRASEGLAGDDVDD
ncbi:hypothetical protein HXX76_009026 [Chlamydomonas incerta]|uniref:Dynein axonemal assembly factor 4 n=1 Tax=Chlamydomonas incerta TaxID=51695 RepID=A0A835SRY6_CHLIN|nr:hypothetical protein HXX76_009026 [Chlamydomonas incerta]|eukprot:KAG2432099.1 hypothetical protein HXX76_009026 [Chlamydomonas incerta]